MKTKILKDLFLNELADIADAEKQLAQAIPQWQKHSTCAPLTKALEDHGKKSQTHTDTISQVFDAFEATHQSKSCKATKGLIAEIDDLLKEFADSPAINAALNFAVIKVEQYEVVSYRKLHEWAQTMNNFGACGLLQGILDDEVKALAALQKIATEHCDPQALGACASHGIDPGQKKTCC